MKLPSGRLYTSAQVRDIDRAAIDALGGDGYALMTKAAGAAYRRLRARWPEAKRIAVVCGQGNNGGDGFVLARLALRDGLAVQVVRLAATELPSTADARMAREHFLAEGGIESTTLDVADVIVDALFGIGLTRAPEPAYAAAISAMNAAAAPIVSLDVPSGLDADTGAAFGDVVEAALTVCFVRMKAGLVTGIAPNVVGDCVLETLDTDAQVEPFAELIGTRELQRGLPRRKPASHKGDHGHVLVIGGDEDFGGAVRMAGEAALRAGAGLVRVATRPANIPPIVASCAELMTVDAANVEHGIAASTVVAIGPGLGQAAWAKELLDLALAAGRPLVLDADALNLLAASPRALPGGAIVTPHPGEAARLLGISTKQVEADRYAAADEIARRFHCTAVLKGAGTIVSDGTARAVCAAAIPALAVGGSGDVLTGVIAALRAQGCGAFDSAKLGVALHASAATRAARGRTRGVLARELLEAVSHAAP